MNTVGDEALNVLFREARSYSAWLDTPVVEDTIRQIYEVLKWGPTSTNTSPTRFIFLQSTQAKERLRPALSPGNVAKTMTAPVTVIIAFDLKFYEKLSRPFPHNPAMREVFARNPQLIETTARRNSSLQGAYMMIVARALGLDCGPMSGFDNAKVDEEFFSAGKCEDCEQEFFSRGPREIQFLVQSRIWRPFHAIPTKSTPGVFGGMLSALGPDQVPALKNA